jgi:hypothetical protein
MKWHARLFSLFGTSANPIFPVRMEKVRGDSRMCPGTERLSSGQLEDDMQNGRRVRGLAVAQGWLETNALSGLYRSVV